MARISLNDVMPSAAVVERNEQKPGPSDWYPCHVCGSPVDPKKAEHVEMLTDLTLLIDEESRPDEDSQGAFPVGPTCMKRLRVAARAA